LKKFFAFFSYVLHPLFVPILGAVLFFLYNYQYFSTIQISVVFIQFVIITILLPLTIFYLLVILKKVNSIMIADVSQRKLPLMLNIVLLSVFVTQSIKTEYFGSLYFFLLGGILSSFLLLVGIYFNKKFSIHAVGVVSLLFYAIGLSIENEGRLAFLVPLLIFLIGAVWSSRLYLKAHTNKELFTGLLIGAFSQLVFYYWYCF